MAYKTIFTVLTDSSDVSKHLEQAALMAEAQDAHLEVLTLGIDRTQVGYYYTGANALILQDAIDRATAEADEVEAAASQRLKTRPIAWGQASIVAPLGDLSRPVAARARFSDLAVLGVPYGNNRGPEAEVIIEAVLFPAGVPVLVMPEGCSLPKSRGRVVLGWNESPEAMHAIRAALPLLKSAGRVSITVVDPPSHSSERSDPGGPLAAWLARHGVKAEIDVLSKSVPRVSDVLMRHAEDVNADLLVMGAYGHSRFLESIIGGATRDMLENARMPVLMAH